MTTSEFPTMYAISARIERHMDTGQLHPAVTEWRRTTEIPTFYLMADVQGIVSEDHAERIARKMFTDLGHDMADVHVHATATSAMAHSC